MSDEDPDHPSFEEQLRAFAREFSESVERAAERIDKERLANEIDRNGERFRELAELAGQWLIDQFGSEGPVERPPDHRGGGPHPLDVPTEEQGLALSALESGRWKVKPGTHELVAEEGAPDPPESADLVGELRARDWIAASGELTELGHRALRRWSEASST
jgi:hypothetical protein